MADSKEYMTLPEENGSINISEEVIAAIAVGAAREVEGVTGMMTNWPRDVLIGVLGCLKTSRKSSGVSVRPMPNITMPSRIVTHPPKGLQRSGNAYPIMPNTSTQSANVVLTNLLSLASAFIMVLS